MSLFSAVEGAIKLCKDEQTKMHMDMQHYREILQCLKPQNKIVTEDTEEDTEKDPDILPEEREELELLERALKEALRIRSSTETLKEPQDCNRQYVAIKEQDGKIVKPKESIRASGTTKLKQATIRPISKSSSQHRKESKTSPSSVHGRRATTGHHSKKSRARVNGSSSQKCPVSSAAVVPHRAPRKVQQAVSSSSSLNQGQSHASITHSKYEAIQRSLLSGGDMGKAATTLVPSHKNQKSVSHKDETSAHSSQNGISSEQIARWKSLRSKQNRLWDKVMAMQRKPVPERSHFMERMRTTFLEDWPCGSPDQTRTLLDRLIHQGQDLTHCYQIQQILAKQASKAGTDSGRRESMYKGTLESLETMAAELQKCSSNMKREWEAWDRCRPEGGCLCPAEAKGEWGNKTNVSLLPTVIYTKEEELRELEKLRMEAVLLQQEAYLHQALSDTLYPQVSSMIHGPGCPNPAVLRDTFSLLAEGGERFPSLVLDT
ncbi:uncharacterized protein LOC130119962 [Lampris incognitus]|uniref:uncharacterized protein LOC130119962 n=1 Tax=Lampris incognitus TaxID=2546036 RepID=UPI0024B5A232|nr:uncharacterized protein LOC130119962 [Lampris incognitus]